MSIYQSIKQYQSKYNVLVQNVMLSNILKINIEKVKKLRLKFTYSELYNYWKNKNETKILIG